MHCRVACTSRYFDFGNGMPRHLSCCIDDLSHRIADAVAEVEDIALSPAFKISDGENMSLSKVSDMNIVTNAGAVRGIIIVSEYGNGSSLAVGYLENKRN